jgi:hypothetical protein
LLFKVAGREVDGWALNISRGGLRAILDEPLDLGTEVEVTIADGEPRLSRIVWIQEEPDGAIVGVEFLDVEGPLSIPPPPPSEGGARGWLRPRWRLTIQSPGPSPARAVRPRRRWVQTGRSPRGPGTSVVTSSSRWPRP